MLIRLRYVIPLSCLVMVLGSAPKADAQADPLQFMFNSGQTIQPFFDGWTHNPEGGFDMHFGYLNRNYVEDLHLPIGASNRMSPDGPDRGQPTFFYPRVNRRLFSVTVPADWGDRELIWQVTVNNETYRAVGWLQPEWEILANPRASLYGGPGGENNQPPTLDIEAPAMVAVGETVTMTARVTDDGLPEPRERRGGGQGTLPTFESLDNGPTLPVNVPQVQTIARKQPTRIRIDRVNVTWIQWDGPQGATVEEQGESENGTGTVAVTFGSPGDYLFQVRASDGIETVTQDVSISVR